MQWLQLICIYIPLSTIRLARGVRKEASGQQDLKKLLEMEMALSNKSYGN